MRDLSDVPGQLRRVRPRAVGHDGGEFQRGEVAVDGGQCLVVQGGVERSHPIPGGDATEKVDDEVKRLRDQQSHAVTRLETQLVVVVRHKVGGRRQFLKTQSVKPRFFERGLGKEALAAVTLYELRHGEALMALHGVPSTSSDGRGSA